MSKEAERSKLTEEERRICAELIEEERREREAAFWAVGIVPEYIGEENDNG